MFHKNRAVWLSSNDLDVQKVFFNELKRETFVNNDRGFEKFCDVSIKLLNKHTPKKMKYKRGNPMPFITKDLSKAIMKRSQL